MTDNGFLGSSIPLGKVLGGGFILASALIATTYFITDSIRLDELAALRVNLDSERRRIDTSRSLPQPTAADAIDVSTAQQLAGRIQSLEQERTELVDQLAEISRHALAPESELSELIEQLEGGDKELRQLAVTGLLELRDPRAARAIVEYFWRDPDEATHNILATRIMEYVWASDRELGIDFVTRILQSDDVNHSRWAFEHLSYEAREDNFDDKLRSAIENVALRNENTLVRTRAKLILQTREDWVEATRELKDDNDQ